VTDGDAARDHLELAQVTASTAASGFCLTVDAQTPAGLAWNAPFVANRAMLTWRALSGPQIVNLFIGGTANSAVPHGYICGHVSTLTGGTLCFDPSALGWTPGSRHSVGLCTTQAGVMSLHADDTTVITKNASGGSPPDLASGRLIVGNNGNIGAAALGTWQGYVTRAAACPAGDVSTCH
jgi:hypothetical protein